MRPIYTLFLSLATVFASQGFAQTDDLLPAEPDALVVQLNARAAEGGDLLGDSIGALARIGEWKHVDFWLANGVSKINDQAQLARLAERITAPVILKISGQPEVSVAAQNALAKISKAAIAQAESPARLLAAVKALRGSSDQKLDAMRTLLGGGNPALKILVESAVAATPPAPRDDLLRNAIAMGDGANNALTQLAIYGQGDSRKGALESLIRIDGPELVSDMLMTLYATDKTESEAALAANYFQRRGRMPSHQQAQAFLRHELKKKRNDAAGFVNSGRTETLWSVDESRNGVQFQQARSVIVAYRDAADAAARLRRTGNVPQNWMQESLATDMSYRLMADPDWGDETQIDQMRKSYPNACSGRSLLSAIDDALASDDVPAVVGLLRLIDGTVSEDEADVLLTELSPKITPLVQATTNASARIRYEAASAIARMGSRKSFVGKSYVNRCFREMSELKDRPSAILVETRSEVVLEQETILADLGYDVTVVECVADLEREVARGHELQLIVSKTELYDHPAIELIDRVRRTKLGARVPILFYGPQVAGISTLRWSAVSQLINRPRSTSAYVDMLLNADSKRRLPDLTALDRRLYRKMAADFLSLTADAG